VFTAFVVISGVYFIKVMHDKQEIRIENEKLKHENLLSQFESLKNQVSPHFLFNSLTALKELINQNPASAENYLSHLSLVMRYTLQSNESMTQCLRDEMQIADSYLFLVKIRYGANLIVEKNTDSFYDFHLLPPLAIQTLIENAIKHNEISKRYPLTIKIETMDNQCLRIVNTLQEKITPEISTGKGLTNLSRQYQFLSGNDITISRKNNLFVVDLPLLPPKDDKSIDS
jgi:LytS/YehU family sensor histidine kinase